MEDKKVKFILLYIWLSSFVISIAILVLNIKYTSNDPSGENNTYVKLLNEIIGTYGPQLLIMLAFIFSNKSKKARKVNKNVVYLAIFLSSVYCLIFLYFLLAFHLNIMGFNTVAEVSKYIYDFRPIASTLVIASIAYFFAEKEQ